MKFLELQYYSAPLARVIKLLCADRQVENSWFAPRLLIPYDTQSSNCCCKVTFARGCSSQGAWLTGRNRVQPLRKLGALKLRDDLAPTRHQVETSMYWVFRSVMHILYRTAFPHQPCLSKFNPYSLLINSPATYPPLPPTHSGAPTRPGSPPRPGTAYLGPGRGQTWLLRLEFAGPFVGPSAGLL